LNQKIARLEREITQAERKLAEVKGRLKGLREDRDKLVDAEIVKRVRAASRKGAGIEELLAMIEDKPKRKPAERPSTTGDAVDVDEEVQR